MHNKLICMVLLVALPVVLVVPPVFAEATIIECPKVIATNPFKLIRVENGQDWQTTEASGYGMNCRGYINPQGYLTCFYGPAAHGASDVFTLKRMPPDNTTCKETNIACRFECTTKSRPAAVEKAVKQPRLIDPKKQ